MKRNGHFLQRGAGVDSRDVDVLEVESILNKRFPYQKVVIQSKFHFQTKCIILTVLKRIPYLEITIYCTVHIIVHYRICSLHFPKQKSQFITLLFKFDHDCSFTYDLCHNIDKSIP